MEKHEHYDSDIQMFDSLYTRFEAGTFTDADCDSFGHVMRSVERPRAIELLKKVIAQHPKVGDTYVYLGLILLQENSIVEAIKIFEQAAAIDLYFGSQAYRELEKYYRANNDGANAIKYELLKNNAFASVKEWKNFDYDENGALFIVDAPIIPEHWGPQ